MDGKKTDLITPPIEYEGLFEQTKREVVENFLERTRSAIYEKRKYCLERGLSLDQTNYIITRAIQALASLVPLKNEGEDLYELQLPAGTIIKPSAKEPRYYSPTDDDIPEDAFSL